MTIYDIHFDDTHDMHLENADIAFATEDNIVAQRLTIRLQFLRGEWFLNNKVGLPYPEFVFEKGTDIEDIYLLFKDEIINTEGVDDIVALDLLPNPETKSIRVDFSVNKGAITDSLEVTI